MSIQQLAPASSSFFSAFWRYIHFTLSIKFTICVLRIMQLHSVVVFNFDFFMQEYVTARFTIKSTKCTMKWSTNRQYCDGATILLHGESAYPCTDITTRYLTDCTSHNYDGWFAVSCWEFIKQDWRSHSIKLVKTCHCFPHYYPWNMSPYKYLKILYEVGSTLS